MRPISLLIAKGLGQTYFDLQQDHPLVEALDGIDPDTMTPLQAQQLLYTLKDLSRQKLNG